MIQIGERPPLGNQLSGDSIRLGLLFHQAVPQRQLGGAAWNIQLGKIALLRAPPFFKAEIIALQELSKSI